MKADWHERIIGPEEMTSELKDAFRRANHDDTVNVVIIRGAGKNSFGLLQ